MKYIPVIIVSFAAAISTLAQQVSAADCCAPKPTPVAAAKPAVPTPVPKVDSAKNPSGTKLGRFVRDLWYGKPKAARQPKAAPPAPAKVAASVVPPKKTTSGNHVSCAPGPSSDCKCPGMGAPIVCSEKCRGASCTCGFPPPRHACTKTCRKGHCECKPQPQPVQTVVHPCQCPGMRKEKGEASPGANDCGGSCGSPTVRRFVVTYG